MFCQQIRKIVVFSQKQPENTSGNMSERHRRSRTPSHAAVAFSPLHEDESGETPPSDTLEAKRSLCSELEELFHH